MLSNAYIVEITVDDAADRADDEEPLEVPTAAEARNMLRRLRNNVGHSRGNQQLTRCIEQLKNAFLKPYANAKQASITQFFPLR